MHPTAAGVTLSKVGETDVRIPGTPNPEIDKTFDEGVDALQRGQFSRAARSFTRVIELDPTDAQAHYNLAVCYVETKEYSLGAKHFKKYACLDHEGADRYLKEYINVLERAASLDPSQAYAIVTRYHEEWERSSREANVAGRKVTLDDLLKAADELLFSTDFAESGLTDRFGKAMSAKIPLRFYGIKGLDDLDPRDAFGFGVGFCCAGYAIAKASLGLLGRSCYFASLTQEAASQLCTSHEGDGIPITYHAALMKTGNPIPWPLVRRALDSCMESTFANFMQKLPWLRDRGTVIRNHLVREFVLTGYYVGLWENAKGLTSNK